MVTLMSAIFKGLASNPVKSHSRQLFLLLMFRVSFKIYRYYRRTRFFVPRFLFLLLSRTSWIHSTLTFYYRYFYYLISPFFLLSYEPIRMYRIPKCNMNFIRYNIFLIDRNTSKCNLHESKEWKHQYYCFGFKKRESCWHDVYLRDVSLKPERNSRQVAHSHKPDVQTIFPFKVGRESERIY